jgi:hypothetical protein
LLFEPQELQEKPARRGAQAPGDGAAVTTARDFARAVNPNYQDRPMYAVRNTDTGRILKRRYMTLSEADTAAWRLNKRLEGAAYARRPYGVVNFRITPP